MSISLDMQAYADTIENWIKTLEKEAENYSNLREIDLFRRNDTLALILKEMNETAAELRNYA